MREVFAAFGSEVFRPLMTILLPGMVALSSVTTALLQRYDSLRTLADSRRFESGVVLFLAALALGEILEDVGSRIEHGFDALAERDNAEFTKEWFDYLALKFDHEPVGHRYLRTLVVRLKFQFGLSIGLCCSAAGLPFTTLPSSSAAIGCVVLVAIALYLLWEAKETHLLLGDVRHQLLTRFEKHATGADMAKGAGA